MDSLTRYRDQLIAIFREYEQLYNLSPTPGVETYCIFDTTQDHYLLVEYGWQEKKHIRRVPLYVRIRDGKIQIEEDWTEQGIATDLLRAGIPKEDIVLAFHHPSMRPYSDLTLA
jgi:hypothetical protein